MKRFQAIFAIIALVAGQVTALENPPSWWSSFGLSEQKNAVCPWGFALPIIEDRTWNVKLDSGVWSQPVATDKNIVFVTDTSKETGKANLSIYGLGENLGILKKSFEVSIVETAGLNKYDQPITTPALAITDSGEPLLVYGNGNGKLLRILGTKQVSDGKINGNEFGFGSSPTIFDGRLYISADNRTTYILELGSGKPAQEVKTGKIVSTSVTVWQKYAMFGDNSGKFYIIDRITSQKIKEIPIPSIDAIRSTACIATWQGQTFAVFGSNRGMLHRVRLDDGSFTLASLQVVAGRTGNEFWATPTFHDGFIYIGNEDGALHKIDLMKMTVASRLRLDGNPIFSQAVINNGFLFVTTGNKVGDPEQFEGGLFVVEIKTFTIFPNLGAVKIDGGSYVSPVFAGNRLFVASRSGKVYCFKGMEPDVKIEPQKLVFREIAFDADKISPVSVNVSNSIRYTNISGTVKTMPEDGWLKVSKSDFAGNEFSFNAWVDLDKVQSRTGKLEGQIIVESTFGLESRQKIIPVEVTFEPSPPKFVLSRPSFEYKIRTFDRIVDSLKVSLRQFEDSSKLNFEVKTNDNWFELGNKMFTLSSGLQSTDIPIIIDPEKLIRENPNKLSYKGSFTVSGIFRDKPYNTTTITVSLEIEKSLTLIAIPFISDSETTYSKNITEYGKTFTDSHDFVFTNSSGQGEMIISENPAIDYGDSEIRNWLSLPKSPINAQNNKLSLPVKISISGQKPNKTYKATIKVLFNTGKAITLNVVYKTISPESVKLRFVIGNLNYWVNSQLQPDKLAAAPYVSSHGNTMVPIRPISDPLGFYYGATIEWMPDIKTVLMTMGTRSLRLVIGHNKAYIDNEDGSITEAAISSPPEIKNGRTFIPPKIITDTFGGKSEWIASSKTVNFEFFKPR